MEKLNGKTNAILMERFGRDSIIALATSVDNTPYVRSVDAYYEGGAFYVLTYALSEVAAMQAELAALQAKQDVMAALLAVILALRRGLGTCLKVFEQIDQTEKD